MICCLHYFRRCVQMIIRARFGRHHVSLLFRQPPKMLKMVSPLSSNAYARRAYSYAASRQGQYAATGAQARDMALASNAEMPREGKDFSPGSRSSGLTFHDDKVYATPRAINCLIYLRIKKIFRCATTPPPAGSRFSCAHAGRRYPRL